MTITYDPKHAAYLDEADVRNELTRVHDLCHACRLCTKFCTAFPTLFDMIDQRDDHDAGRLTSTQQDQVIDECFQCKLCAVSCPYTPGRHERALDFPRLMLRAQAMRHATGQVSLRRRVTSQVLSRPDLIGTVANLAAPVANQVVGAKRGSLLRQAVSAVTGVSAVRLLPLFAKQRFSTWFKNRVHPTFTNRQGRVTVFPTCVVEYQETKIGKDLVHVYERNGVECSNSDAGCCGAPWLHSGDLARFTNVAEKNVRILACEVRKGTDIVVPQPTCSYVLRKDYLDYVGGADAELVAEHTYDASEYLLNLHQGGGTRLDTQFIGETYRSITYHASCHLRAQTIGFASRDLMKLTGAKVKLVQQCSGIDGLWGIRSENDQISIPIARELGGLISDAGGDIVTGDCHLANTAITEQTGKTPLHPLSVMARAYGISDEG